MVEIDLTQRCNLSCSSCERFCGVANEPAKHFLPFAMIDEFIRESIEIGRKWHKVRLSGGEATLHPQLFDIMKALAKYRDEYTPKTELLLMTNGVSEFSKSLGTWCNGFYVSSSGKPDDPPPHYPIMISPEDLGVYDRDDNPCGNPVHCGMGYNRNGYFPCNAGGAIARVLRLKIGLRSLKEATPATLRRVCEQFLCRHCGHYLWKRMGYYECPRLAFQPISPFWRKALAEYNSLPDDEK